MKTTATTAQIFNSNLSTDNSVKQQVLRALGWDIEMYAYFQYETGLEYLTRYIKNDPSGIDMLERSRIFWNWWKNHWLQRDSQFLRECTGDVNRKRIVQMYKTKHSVDHLIGEIYPSAVILDNDYCSMIGQVNDEIKSAK